MAANALICALRSARYAATEPLWLRVKRCNSRDYRTVAGLVSVYIPTFNRVGLLMERGLPSVLAQTHPRWELIVAAHGCTDGTADTVRRLDDPRVRVIEVPRKRTYPPVAFNHWAAGPVAPANAALRECRGDWIARIDDDDAWAPEHLEKMLTLAREGDYEFVSSAHDAASVKVDPYIVNGVKIGGTQTWVYRGYLKFMRYNPGCWRKKHNRINDVDLQDRMVRAGVRMGYLDEVTCHILPRPGETEIGSKAYLADERRTEATFAF